MNQGCAPLLDQPWCFAVENRAVHDGLFTSAKVAPTVLIAKIFLGGELCGLPSVAPYRSGGFEDENKTLLTVLLSELRFV